MSTRGKPTKSFSTPIRSEQKFGLPKLQKDAAGAPEIAENATAEAGSTDGKAKDIPNG